MGMPLYSQLQLCYLLNTGDGGSLGNTTFVFPYISLWSDFSNGMKSPFNSTFEAGTKLYGTTISLGTRLRLRKIAYLHQPYLWLLSGGQLPGSIKHTKYGVEG